jgi:TrpR-related protein YerC/YecD
MIKHASLAELQRLYEAFARTQDAEAVAALMEDLCTIREVNEMAQRLTVAVLLDAGASYTEVQDATGASATTIARVSKCLNHGSGGYRRVLESVGAQHSAAARGTQHSAAARGAQHSAGSGDAQHSAAARGAQHDERDQNQQHDGQDAQT